MASVSSALPRIFHWVFLLLAVFSALFTLAVGIVILVNPHLPPGTHFGPATFDFLGQPGTAAFRAAGGDFSFAATAFRGTVTVTLDRAAGLFELLKRYGLPVLLLKGAFYAALFELLRRLFRNVERGETFSRDTIVLVQGVGGLLIVFSFVFSFATDAFVHAVYAYLAQHAQVAVSGAPIRLPAAHGGVHFGVSLDSLFFSGLLVLALSEVFRQGLALRKENELTI
jgi:hypothetical protein